MKTTKNAETRKILFAIAKIVLHSGSDKEATTDNFTVQK
jgi:hypothetical protein